MREAAEKIVALLETGVTGVVHVGGPRRTVYEYAKSLDPDREIGALDRLRGLPRPARYLAGLESV